MALFDLRRRERALPPATGDLAPFLSDFSIEVMPRTAAKIDDFRPLLPEGTRVYVAHIEGTPIDDMVATAKRLRSEGFRVMPHFPARLIETEAMLGDWIARYCGEADVSEALVLAGGLSEPRGVFDSSMALLATGAFEAAGFTRLHVAGHPEGNKDIDPGGGVKNVTEALLWKQDYARRTSAEMAIVTQFAFEAGPVIDWAEGLRRDGITLPVHIGIAGPAKLQTLIKFAVACGVGPSLRVLERRALDVTKLLLPYEPTEVVAALAAHKAAHPDFAIERVHLFPLGGIVPSAEWARDHGAAPAAATT